MNHLNKNINESKSNSDKKEKSFIYKHNKKN